VLSLIALCASPAWPMPSFVGTASPVRALAIPETARKRSPAASTPPSSAGRLHKNAAERVLRSTKGAVNAVGFSQTMVALSRAGKMPVSQSGTEGRASHRSCSRVIMHRWPHSASRPMARASPPQSWDHTGAGFWPLARLAVRAVFEVHSRGQRRCVLPRWHRR